MYLIAMLVIISLLLLVTPSSAAVEFSPLVGPRKPKVFPKIDSATDDLTNNKWMNRPSKNQHSRFDIKQPADSMLANDVKPMIDGSKDCSPDYPICTNIVDYPQNLVNEIVARQEYRFVEVFGDDVVVDSGDILDKRFDTSDDEFLCSSVEKLVHPQSGYTIDNKLVMIVNTPNYIQGVRIETCRNPGGSCYRLEHMISLYKTECKQLYHYRTLLAFDEVTKLPYKESFRLPSCCKCVIRPIRRDHL